MVDLFTKKFNSTIIVNKNEFVKYKQSNNNGFLELLHSAKNELNKYDNNNYSNTKYDSFFYFLWSWYRK